MKHINLWSPLAQHLGEIDICTHWLFCTKFNAQKLLFEAFSDIMRIFSRIEPQTEYTFPFQYSIIFETYQSSERLALLQWGGGETCAPTDFFVRNPTLNDFHFEHFLIQFIFLATSSTELNLLFIFQYIIIFDTNGQWHHIKQHRAGCIWNEHFPTFETDQNEPIDVGPSTSRALTLQEPVIYFDQPREDPARYSKIAKFFSPDANTCCKCVKAC